MESEERPGGKLARIKHGGRRNGLAERQTVGSTGSHRTTRKPPSKSSQGGAKAEGLTFVSGPCLPPVLPRVIVVRVCVYMCVCLTFPLTKNHQHSKEISVIFDISLLSSESYR